MAGFPTGAANMEGGSSKFDWGEGLSQCMERAWGGGGVKMLLENTCEGVHLIVNLPSICLQACKFAKNEPLHTYF